MQDYAMSFGYVAFGVAMLSAAYHFSFFSRFLKGKEVVVDHCPICRRPLPMTREYVGKDLTCISCGMVFRFGEDHELDRHDA